VINIGCGERHSVNKIAELIGNAKISQLTARGRVKFVPPRRGESRHTCADFRKARQLLGWKPEIKLEAAVNDLKKIYKLA